MIIATLGIAIIYAITAKLSVDFAVLPGKVTAVWLPAGMTLAIVSWFGYWAVPGITIGSVAGLSWDLLNLTPTFSLPHFIVLNFACIVANCLQPIVAVAIIYHLTGENPSLNRTKSVTSFLIAASVAPLLSATVGVTTLSCVGVIPWANYWFCWLTWWLASSLAILLFTPPLLLWPSTSSPPHPRWGEIGCVLSLTLGLCGLTFVFSDPVEYALIPVLIWVVFRLGSFSASVFVSLIAVIAIVATSQNLGAFATASNVHSLVLLQSFLAVCSITTLVLGAVLNERKAAELKLEHTLLDLEQQVLDRTAELEASKNILDGFFSVAPVGMGIVDQNLCYLKVNQRMAEMNGCAIEAHPGQKVRDLLPNLAADIEPVYRHVLAQSEPVLNREESGCLPNQPGKRTWLTSYFPIFRHNQIPTQVGVILLEITELKQLEMRLRQQAYMDGLTQIANRHYFNEVFDLEWRRCARTQKPLSLVLADLDEFKRYNDTYGHLVGDECLTRFATMLTQTVNRAGDVVARYGGEEFVVLLPETSPEGALHIAQVIHQSTRQLQIPHHSSSVCSTVTASIGVASCLPTVQGYVTDLIEAADIALYESKRQGRDRVTQVILNHDAG